MMIIHGGDCGDSHFIHRPTALTNHTENLVDSFVWLNENAASLMMAASMQHGTHHHRHHQSHWMQTQSHADGEDPVDGLSHNEESMRRYRLNRVGLMARQLANMAKQHSGNIALTQGPESGGGSNDSGNNSNHNHGDAIDLSMLEDLYFCTDCLGMLFEMLDQESHDLERHAAKVSATVHTDDEDGSAQNMASLDEQIEQLRLEEETLREQLLAYQEESRMLQAGQKVLLSESKKQSDKEARHWKTFFVNMDYVGDNVRDRLRANRATVHALEEQNRLKRIYPETLFHIWYTGDFGTINGLRLGRLGRQQRDQESPSTAKQESLVDAMISVDWKEVNAAWGLVALLLHVIASERSFFFSMYRIIPMGSASKVEDINSGNLYELYVANECQQAYFIFDERLNRSFHEAISRLRDIYPDSIMPWRDF